MRGSRYFRSPAREADAGRIRQGIAQVAGEAASRTTFFILDEDEVLLRAQLDNS
jgi:hypothetical protein